jgi:hypothetical protein
VYHDHTERFDNGQYREPDITEAEMFVSATGNTNGTWHNGQTERLLGNSVSAVQTVYSTVMKRTDTVTSGFTYILLTTAMNLI